MIIPILTTILLYYLGMEWKYVVELYTQYKIWVLDSFRQQGSVAERSKALV